MRMSELSATSGVAVATIKYYQRENLLPDGERTGSNQTQYDATHVERLRLIRALIDVGGISVASARRVIEAIDSKVALPYIFETAQHVVSAEIEAAAVSVEALERIDAVMDGWHVSPESPGRLAAARVLQTFEGVGQADARGWFARYAAAALLVAEADLDEVAARPDREAMAETVVVGTVLGDALFSGLRRAAQEHITSLRFDAGPDHQE